MEATPTEVSRRADPAAPDGARRVVFVSSLLRFGGGERWMLDTAERLRARGREVRLVARPGSAIGERARARDLPLTTVQMRGDFDPLAVAGLARLFLSFRPHVVLPNLDREIRLCALALRLSGLRRYGAVRLVPRRGSEFPLKNKRHYRFFYQRDVDSVIVNSLATKRTMVESAPWFPREKAVVVYNGIDTEPYERLDAQREMLRTSLRDRLGAARTAPVVTLVGELNARKGQQHVIQAAGAVLERHPQTRFLFVGEGDARPTLERAIRERGLEGVVNLIGFRDDVPEIVAGSDVVILPSSVEGFGYALVEAMAVSVPVVASNASSIPEIVEDNVTGYLHPVGDVPAIASAIGRLLASPDEARAMGERGRQTVRTRFGIERMVDEVEAVLFPGMG